MRYLPSVHALVAITLTAEYPQPLPGQVTSHRLENGLQILLIHDPAANDIDVTAGFFVGHRDDRLHGTAHLMEHLAMRETRSGSNLAARYGPLGVNGGARTTADLTMFSMTGRGDVTMLDTLFSLQRQRMSDLAIAEAAVTAERRRVHTEVDGRTGQAWLKPLFAAGRAGAENSHRDLDRITPTELATFYARYYVASNAMLVVRSAFPDSVVIARARAILGPLPAGNNLLRPVYRDSTPIAAGRWRGIDSTGQRVEAFVAPGIQHPWNPLLAATVALTRERLQARRSPVRIRFDNGAPVAVLTLSAPAGPNADEELRAALAALREAIPGSRSDSADLGPDALLTCEAAGSWRFCLANAAPDPSATAGLLALFDSVPPSPALKLWPTPVRSLPAAAQPSVAAAKLERHWMKPDASPIKWRQTSSGMEWLARAGGVADTVHLLVVLAPSDSAPTGEAIAALELLARAFPTLRSASGDSVAGGFQARGIQVAARSLPYPTMATSDRFLLIGTAPSPVGLYGLELQISAATSAAPLALRMVREALSTASLDPSAFEALQRDQIQLLSESQSAPNALASVLYRQRIAASFGGSGARFAPAEVSDQLAAIRKVTAGDVIEMARAIVQRGAGRIAILGAGESMAEKWIAESGLAGLRGLHWGGSGLACGAADTATRIARAAGPAARNRTSLWSYHCSPPGTPSPVLVIANAAIGGFEDAILAHRLRSELGIAYAFFSRVIPVWDTPAAVWLLNIDTPLKGIEQVAAEIRATLQSAPERLTDEIFENARRTVAAGARNRATEPFAWLTSALWRDRLPEHDLLDYERITLPGVRAAMASHWRADRIAIVYGAPPP